jgi:hypothetical protein
VPPPVTVGKVAVSTAISVIHPRRSSAEDKGDYGRFIENFLGDIETWWRVVASPENP